MEGSLTERPPHGGRRTCAAPPGASSRAPESLCEAGGWRMEDEENEEGGRREDGEREVGWSETEQGQRRGRERGGGLKGKGEGEPSDA
eukprot:735218-Rhodomonas_salina.1